MSLYCESLLKHGGETLSRMIQVKETITKSHITKGRNQEITELRRTITPTHASSRVLLIACVGMCGADSAADVGFSFMVGGNNISDSEGTSAGSTACSAAPFMNMGGGTSVMGYFYYIHHPNSTSEQTYSLMARPNSGRTVYINRRGSDSTFTTPTKLMAIEIGRI